MKNNWKTNFLYFFFQRERLEIEQDPTPLQLKHVTTAKIKHIFGE